MQQLHLSSLSPTPWAAGLCSTGNIRASPALNGSKTGTGSGTPEPFKCHQSSVLDGIRASVQCHTDTAWLPAWQEAPSEVAAGPRRAQRGSWNVWAAKTRRAQTLIHSKTSLAMHKTIQLHPPRSQVAGKSKEAAGFSCSRFPPPAAHRCLTEPSKDPNLFHTACPTNTSSLHWICPPQLPGGSHRHRKCCASPALYR